MTKDEALKLALDALDLLAKYENPSTKIQVRKPRDGGPIVTMYPHKVATDAAALLRERLAQPEQEPVIDRSAAVRIATALGWEPKRTWVGLTDEERAQVINANFGTGLWAMAKDVEAKLKEKNA